MSATLAELHAALRKVRVDFDEAIERANVASAAWRRFTHPWREGMTCEEYHQDVYEGGKTNPNEEREDYVKDWKRHFDECDAAHHAVDEVKASVRDLTHALMWAIVKTAPPHIRLTHDLLWDLWGAVEQSLYGSMRNDAPIDLTWDKFYSDWVRERAQQ